MKPAEAAAAPRNYLASLQAFRGLAAVSVLLFHLGKLFHQHLGIAVTGRRWLQPGYLGADFFFVLSGSIIFYTHRDDIGQPSALRKFIVRRLTRLYPVFWTVCLIKLAMLAVMPGGAKQLTPGYITASLLLIPQPGWPLLDVAWTLSYELFFYAMFLLLIWRGARLWQFIIIHAGIVIAANLPGMARLEFPLSFLASPYFLEFYAGCLACHLARRRHWRKREAFTVLAAGAGLVGVGWLRQAGVVNGLPFRGELAQALFWGTAFAMITLSAAMLGPRLDRFVPRPLKFLGDASYSIYLIHGGVINAAVVLLKNRAGGMLSPGDLLALLVGAAALAAGCAYHLAVEKPLLNRCRRWFPEKRPAI
ncbi:MAG: acyltransferase [Verrucomicrobia bacterium]|nr:acyltransferase [Verrucomicrobiota bacterium]